MTTRRGRAGATTPVGSPVLLLLCAVPACVDNVLIPEPTSETCPDTPAAPTAVTVEPTCSQAEPVWALERRWRWDEVEGYLTPHVGRFGDADGDGAITSADPIGIWLVHITPSGVPQFEVDARGDTVWSSSEWEDQDMALVTLGDVDPTRVGMEHVLGVNVEAGQLAAAASRDEVLYAREVTSAGGAPFLVDLEADGVPEVLWTDLVTSALDGRPLFTFAGVGQFNVGADLDLDGYAEILTTDGTQPLVVDHEGNARATCPVDVDTDYTVRFAIGNLDDDDDAEFVVAGYGVLAVCEADGTLVAQAATDGGPPDLVGIAELDGDARPEIVAAWCRTGTGQCGVAAWDDTLDPLWFAETVGGHSPFALADLDGDGRHEIIVNEGTLVSILSPDGEPLARAEGPTNGLSLDAPIVSDLDGDGLAEILVTGRDPNLVVYDNGVGGWAVVGTDEPWPGPDHFPGDRNPDGSVPPAGGWWLAPGRNVWQGLAAGPPALPDLAVSIADACSEDCAEIVLSVEVSNVGSIATQAPVTVEILGLDDGTVLASDTLPALDAGARQTALLRVASRAAGSGVRAVVNRLSPIAECADAPDEATLTDLPCR